MFLPWKSILSDACPRKVTWSCPSEVFKVSLKNRSGSAVAKRGNKKMHAGNINSFNILLIETPGNKRCRTGKKPEELLRIDRRIPCYAFHLKLNLRTSRGL